MISGIDLNQTADFISKFDKGDQKTIWKIGVLSSPILSFCTGRENAMDVMIEVVRFGVKGIENFRNKQGVVVPFLTVVKYVNGRSCNVVHDDIMDIIPLKVIGDIGAKILEISSLTDDETKN